MLDAKESWNSNIRLGSTVGDAARRSMGLLVVLLFSLLTTTNRSAAGCRWLSVASAALRQKLPLSWLLPFDWRCLLAVATVCCLGSLLFCLTVWCQVSYVLVYVFLVEAGIVRVCAVHHVRRRSYLLPNRPPEAAVWYGMRDFQIHFWVGYFKTRMEKRVHDSRTWENIFIYTEVYTSTQTLQCTSVVFTNKNT